MAGRREHLRAKLMAEIGAAALAELRRTGPADLSLREVARAAGISPSGLYRYVDGRDGLLELLIADGFDTFGAAIGEAIAEAGDDVTEQLRALTSSYRRWALDNPEQFALILGSPVHGFSARPTGPTMTAVRQFGAPMLALFARAYADGQLATRPDEVEDAIDLNQFDGVEELPQTLLDTIMRGWGRVHGLVSLEVFGHLAWSGVEVDTLLDEEVDRLVAELAEPN